MTLEIQRGGEMHALAEARREQRAEESLVPSMLFYD